MRNMKPHWPLLTGVCFLLSLMSFCAARTIYSLENKPPEYIEKEVVKRVEVPRPCPSHPPPPPCTPPPPPPFDVILSQKKWSGEGSFMASYQVVLPADGQWHDSRIQVKPGLSLLWNYDNGYSGGVQIRVDDALEETKYLPLDYDRAFFRYRFVRRNDYQDYDSDQRILEVTRTVLFRAFEKDVALRVELWER